MLEPIENKVAKSSLVSINLEDYYHPGERIAYDLTQNLFKGLVLKEKDFREFIKQHDWTRYLDKNIAIICSTDAIIPTWAYMLLVAKMEQYANMVVIGNLEALEQSLFQQAIAKIDLKSLKGAKVVIKGCGDVPVPNFAYGELTRVLTPVVSSIMYGEPCSTVPVYKQPVAKGEGRNRQ